MALLALIGIPIIIIIYLIKNKFTEQVISSTYLWTLSEKFLRKRNPIRLVSGLLSLILQCLIIAIVAIALAQPVFVAKGKAADYLFILDGSGSMNITLADGTTRFDEGVNEIKSVVGSASEGSTYTVLYSGSSMVTVCSEMTSKSQVSAALDTLEGSYCPSNLQDAYIEAQNRFDENNSLRIYLYTDKDYEETNSNFQIINLSSGEENYAVSDVEYVSLTSSFTVTGNLWSYASDARLEVTCSVDGEISSSSSQTIDVSKLEPAPFTFTFLPGTFSSLTVTISDKDAMPEDNECVVYNMTSDATYKTLIITNTNVSDNSFFLQSILSAIGNVEVTTISQALYNGETGYGLYIYDSCDSSKITLPSDGAVWFVNPQGSVANTGFSVQAQVDLQNMGTLSQSTSTSSKVKELLSGTQNSNIYISAYTKCSQSRSFYNLLMYNTTPVLFAGTNVYNNREVVFAFDFHETDFVLTADFVVLMHNLFGYTFPEIIDGTSFYAGDTIEVNVLANTTSIRVDAPDGKVSYLAVDTDINDLTLDEVGTYVITLTTGSSERQVKIYSSLPLEERYTSVRVKADGSFVSYDTPVLTAAGDVATDSAFLIAGTYVAGGHDGTYSEIWAWLVALAVLVALDWGVYCYEQYQLK